MYKRVNFWLVAVLAALLMFGITPKNRSQEPPQVFSAVNQFSITQNPNGPWSYGFTEGLGGPFTLHTNNCTTSCGPGGIYQGWFGPILSFYPWVVTSAGARFINILDLHPAEPNFYSVVRWTAPTSGRFDLLGLFLGVNPGGVDVHILKNGVSAFDGEVRTALDTSIFDLHIMVNQGDTIDFAVGIGGDGSMNGDATGLKATVTGPLDE